MKPAHNTFRGRLATVIWNETKDFENVPIGTTFEVWSVFHCLSRGCSPTCKACPGKLYLAGISYLFGGYDRRDEFEGRCYGYKDGYVFSLTEKGGVGK